MLTGYVHVHVEDRELHPFLFGMSGAELTPEELQLAASMRSCWGQFADTGVPGLGLPAQPAWLPYTLVTPTVQSLVAPRPNVDLGFAERHHCAFWQAILLQASALSALASAH